MSSHRTGPSPTGARGANMKRDTSKATAAAAIRREQDMAAKIAETVALYDQGMRPIDIRAALGIGENTVLRRLKAGGRTPQLDIYAKAAEKRKAEAERKAAAKLHAKTFRDMKGEQQELFPYICKTCGRPIEKNGQCAECRAHCFGYDHENVVCGRCGKTFAAKQMGRKPKYCPECSKTIAEERNKTWRKTHRCPSDVGGNFNARARRLCRKYGGHYEPVNYESIFERDGWTCYICGVELKRGQFDNSPNSPTLDHVIALASGGHHSPNNLKPCCFACNSKKSGGSMGGDLTS